MAVVKRGEGRVEASMQLVDHRLRHNPCSSRPTGAPGQVAAEPRKPSQCVEGTAQERQAGDSLIQCEREGRRQSPRAPQALTVLWQRRGRDGIAQDCGQGRGRILVSELRRRQVTAHRLWR